MITIFSVEPKKFDDYARSLKLNKIVKKINLIINQYVIHCYQINLE